MRTGSLKNKVIPADTSRTLTAPSNYAVYNIQTGCFTWQGRSVLGSNIDVSQSVLLPRAYYKNSYMIQRNDGRSRRSFLEQNNRRVDSLLTKNYPKQFQQENPQQQQQCPNRVRGPEKSSKNCSQHETRYLENGSACQNNHFLHKGKD